MWMKRDWCRRFLMSQKILLDDCGMHGIRPHAGNSGCKRLRLGSQAEEMKKLLMMCELDGPRPVTMTQRLPVEFC
jgi:hypothetical protein